MDISVSHNLKVKNNGKSLILKTPIIKIPFGVEKVFNNQIVKLELPKDNIFSQLILNIEKKLCEILGIDEISSQIIKSKKPIFGDLLITKIIRYKDQLKIDIDRNNEIDVVSNIKKGDKGIATLEIDKLWKYDGKYTYKIKLKHLALL
tara:strand:- start:3014 stop:3457 length:444 start_codon:yes stop_codon:yes gene_type:complete